MEAFLESEHGYRWRLYDRDAVSAIVFEMQQFDEKARVWRVQEKAELIIGFDEIEAIYAAMKAVRDNAPKN